MDMNVATLHSRQPRGAAIAGRRVGGEFAPHLRTPANTSALEEPHPLLRQFDQLEDKIEAMSGEVEKLVEGLQSDEGWNNYLSAMSQFHRYSFTNQLLIASQLPNATRVAGKGVWKALGREVKPFAERGNGASIFRPIIASVDRVDATGAKILGPDGEPLRDRRPVGYSATTVYDLAQTSGDPLPSAAPVMTADAPEGLIPDLQSSINALGYSVTFEKVPGSAKGFTSLDGRVVIDESLPPGERAYVLAHELGHIAAGHLDEGTAEYHSGPGGQRGRMEIEAESIGHVLLRMNGMDPSPQSGPYAAGWARTQMDNPDVVKKCAAKVQVTVSKLIGERSWVNVPDSGPVDRPARKPRTAKRKK